MLQFHMSLYLYCDFLGSSVLHLITVKQWLEVLREISNDQRVVDLGRQLLRPLDSAAATAFVVAKRSVFEALRALEIAVINMGKSVSAPLNRHTTKCILHIHRL